MSKSYLILIVFLVLVALGVGGFAFYKTAMKPMVNAPSVTPMGNPSPSVTVTPTESPEMTNEQLSAQNTLPLTVAAPKDGSEVATATITVSGTTAAGADVAVNDKDLVADGKGIFSTTVTLDEGQNYILVVASSENGSAEWQGTVTYTPKQ